MLIRSTQIRQFKPASQPTQDRTVSSVPDKIIIRCEKCKRESNLSKIGKAQGLCPSCQHDRWHIQAIYEGASGNDITPSGVAMNVVGIGLALATGGGFTSEISGAKQTVNGFDIHEVAAETLRSICEPDANPNIKLRAFVTRKRNDAYQEHRSKMEEKGANCEQCDVLFVVSPQKPWTMAGCCSKVCCATKFHSTDYALIEDKVLAATRDSVAHFEENSRDNSRIEVECSCGYRFTLPTMYRGIYRKCPSCQRKILIPEN